MGIDGSQEFRDHFPDGAVVKNLPASAGDPRDKGSIPRSGRSPGVGNGNPLKYSCLENPWTEEPDGLLPMGYSPWGPKEPDVTKHAHASIPEAATYVLMLPSCRELVTAASQHCVCTLILRRQNSLPTKPHSGRGRQTPDTNR